MTYLIPVKPEWHEKAACKDYEAELFFPLSARESKPAIAVCDACPVSLACLKWALQKDIRHGVWGGTTEQEREVIRRDAL